MDIRFDDYNAYPDSDIREVTETGIVLSAGQRIDYAACAANFQAVHGGSGRCVGEREVGSSDYTIAFYTAPLSTHIIFVPGSKLSEFFKKENAVNRYHALLKHITDAGYTTYDES